MGQQRPRKFECMTRVGAAGHLDLLALEYFAWHYCSALKFHNLYNEEKQRQMDKKIAGCLKRNISHSSWPIYQVFIPQSAHKMHAGPRNSAPEQWSLVLVKSGEAIRRAEFMGSTCQMPGFSPQSLSLLGGADSVPWKWPTNRKEDLERSPVEFTY